MVTRSDIISSRWSSHFLVEMYVFLNLFSAIKVNLVDEVIQSDYLYVILLVKHTKITIYRDFNLISNSWKNPRWRPLLVTSQASSSATTHRMYLIL